MSGDDKHLDYRELLLGKESAYPNAYQADVLHAIARNKTREKLLESSFSYGFDHWNAYEFSWLDAKGMPQVAILGFHLNCHSQNIIESKSLKLYLNGFSFESFEDIESIKQLIETDLGSCAQGKLSVDIFPLQEVRQNIEPPSIEEHYADAVCLDRLVLDEPPCFDHVQSSLLSSSTELMSKPVLYYSELFRSVCPVTGQPDWASFFIHYQGKKPLEKNLLRYLLSFRKHQGFHEDCVERVYSDVMEKLSPDRLSVYAAFTRRGGIDINPFRSNFEASLNIGRQPRQ